MNYFKHFVDAHESTSMMNLMETFGSAGYGNYFILMSLIIKKINKDRAEIITEDHCRARLHERLLREKLRLSSTKLEAFLNQCSTNVLLSFEKSESEFHFYMPNILIFLNRDAKRARHGRVQGALKKGEGDIEIEVEEESAGQPIFKTDPKTEEILSNVPRDIQASWLAMYGDRVWIAKRLQKFVSWCLQKPSRMNQDWPVFFGGKLHEDFEAEPPKKRRPATSEPQIDGCCAREDYDSAASMPLPSPETAAEANAKISALLGRQLTIVKTEGV